MAIWATLSTWGLYNIDASIFDMMKLPQGMDKTIFINNLILKCGKLEILYPDPEFMKRAIKAWSDSRIETWTKLSETLKLEYNPLYNKDGYAEEMISRDRSQDSSSSDHVNGSGESIESVKGFNADSWSEHTKVDGTTEQTGSGTSSLNEDENTVRKLREYGNIGVTTSQQMLEAELALREKWNMYDYIINEYENRFCILTY